MTRNSLLNPALFFFHFYSRRKFQLGFNCFEICYSGETIRDNNQTPVILPLCQYYVLSVKLSMQQLNIKYLNCIPVCQSTTLSQKHSHPRKCEPGKQHVANKVELFCNFRTQRHRIINSLIFK